LRGIQTWIRAPPVSDDSPSTGINAPPTLSEPLAAPVAGVPAPLLPSLLLLATTCLLTPCTARDRRALMSATRASWAASCCISALMDIARPSAGSYSLAMVLRAMWMQRMTRAGAHRSCFARQNR